MEEKRGGYGLNKEKKRMKDFKYKTLWIQPSQTIHHKWLKGRNNIKKEVKENAGLVQKKKERKE